MVEIVLYRTDSSSVATVLVGDIIVVCVHDGPDARRWTVEDSGQLTLDESACVENDGANPTERRFRFRATVIGESSLRLALRAEDAHVVDTLLLAVEVHDQPPSSALHLFRKRR
jgi:hypothetical protein